MKPLILVNFKTYKESTADNALKLARSLARIRKSKYQIAIAPSLLTIKEIKEKTNIMVFSQHTDHVVLGAHTGRIPAEELRSLGIHGTLLNHSERRIPLKFLRVIVENCKKEKLKTIVCAATLSEVKKIAHLEPDYIAYEPKELIGGKVSVTESKPEIIFKAVQIVNQISPGTKVLCGAGIHSKQDLSQALLLGTHGILLASAVVKAQDPKKFLEGMLG